MPFPPQVKEDALVACKRHCCLCHKQCGIKIEIHHIKPKSEGGSDTYENAIPLCFDCHSDMRTYDSKHPKGAKYSESELIRRRNQWYATAATINGPIQSQQVPNPLSADETQIAYDKALLCEIGQLLPIDAIQRIRNEEFGSFVPEDVITPFDRFLERCNDPAFRFHNPRLEEMRSNAQTKASKFLEYFSQQSGGGINGYDYINLNEARLRNPDCDINYWIQYSRNTSKLASEFCDVVLQIRGEMRHF